MSGSLIERVIAADAAMLAHLGFDVTHVSSDRVAITGVPPVDLANSFGVVHGAFAFSLMDTAAANALAAREIHAVTIGSHCSFTGAVTRAADILAEARVQTTGRTLATVRAELTVDGKIASIGTFEFLVRPNAV